MKLGESILSPRVEVQAVDGRSDRLSVGMVNGQRAVRQMSEHRKVDE